MIRLGKSSTVVRVGISNRKVKVDGIINWCRACPNLCEFTQISVEGRFLARWGDAVTFGKEWL